MLILEVDDPAVYAGNEPALLKCTKIQAYVYVDYSNIPGVPRTRREHLIPESLAEWIIDEIQGPKPD